MDAFSSLRLIRIHQVLNHQHLGGKSHPTFTPATMPVSMSPWVVSVILNPMFSIQHQKHVRLILANLTSPGCWRVSNILFVVATLPKSHDQLNTDLQLQPEWSKHQELAWRYFLNLRHLTPSPKTWRNRMFAFRNWSHFDTWHLQGLQHQKQPIPNIASWSDAKEQSQMEKDRPKAIGQFARYTVDAPSTHYPHKFWAASKKLQ